MVAGLRVCVGAVRTPGGRCPQLVECLRELVVTKADPDSTRRIQRAKEISIPRLKTGFDPPATCLPHPSYGTGTFVPQRLSIGLLVESLVDNCSGGFGQAQMGRAGSGSLGGEWHPGGSSAGNGMSTSANPGLPGFRNKTVFLVARLVAWSWQGMDA